MMKMNRIGSLIQTFCENCLIFLFWTAFLLIFIGKLLFGIYELIQESDYYFTVLYEGEL